LGLVLKSSKYCKEALSNLNFLDTSKGGDLIVSVKAKNILREFASIIEEAGLFLATVKNENHTYPQLVVAGLPPTKKGVESFCFFLFPYIITKTDDGNKIHNPKEIQLLTIYPCKGKISGISEGSFNKKIQLFYENIKKLMLLRDILSEMNRILKN
jgi:hypothetical protein